MISKDSDLIGFVKEIETNLNACENVQNCSILMNHVNVNEMAVQSNEHKELLSKCNKLVGDYEKKSNDLVEKYDLQVNRYNKLKEESHQEKKE